MKRLLGIGTIALVTLAMGISAKAEPQTTQQLQRRLAWSEQHIRQLNHRRAYLHRYIRHLRNPTPFTSQPTSSGAGTTPSATTPTASGGWSDELRAAGFPESSISTMLAIIDRESGGNPNAVNPSSGACGLLQLYPCYGGSAWLDPMTNLRLGYQKYQASGFAPWS